MAKFELKLPKMGESVAEATITNWLKKVGEKIDVDEVLLEIATDKVDSELPSEVSGTLIEILFQVNDVVKVGQTIAIIETNAEASGENSSAVTNDVTLSAPEVSGEMVSIAEVATIISEKLEIKSSDKFYSPLVKNIASAEGISVTELDAIAGSGKDGRVTKEDILNHIKNRGSQPAVVAQPETRNSQSSTQAIPVSINGGDEIIEMDRMRKLIAGYMVASVQTSAHVQSFIEVDVTNI